MHPYETHSGVAALAHDLVGRLGFRDNDNAINAAWNRLQVGVASIAFKGLQVRVHGEHFAPIDLQPTIDRIRGRIATAVARVLSDQIYWDSLRLAAFPISGSSHRFLVQTQGETRRPGTLSIQLPA